MSDQFFKIGYNSYCRVQADKGLTPKSYVEYVATQKKVFREDVVAGHGPVSIYKV